MKLIFIVLFAAGLLSAQTLTVVGPAAPVVAGSPVTLTFTINGSAGLNIAAIQASISVPANALLTPAGSIACAAGAASSAAGKTLACAQNSTSGSSIWVACGINASIYADGAVATLTFTVPAGTTPGALPITLSGLLGASLAGEAVPITAGPAYTLNVVSFSACDVNQDKLVNYADVALMRACLLNGSGGCPDLNGDGVVDIVDMQRVATAANGGSCKVGA